MALKSPLAPSPSNNLVSAFSPYTDSPSSPRKFDSPTDPSSSNRSSYLSPHTQPSPLAHSPSDIADPSPISTSSNGTNTTEIEDTAAENVEDHTPEPKSARPDLELETAEAADKASKPRSDEDEQPSSVIHAPQGFDAWKRDSSSSGEIIDESPQKSKLSPTSARRSTPTAASEGEIFITPPEEDASRKSSGPASPPPLQTAVAPVRDWSSTPRAQSRQDMEHSPQEERKKSSRSSSRSSTLADIPEIHPQDPERTPNPNEPSLFEHTVERLKEENDEVAALNKTLRECWTLCNTLAGLSHVHRERIFKFSGNSNPQEQAWKSCWRLCQKLYETRDEEASDQVRPALDLCREFCQCLFDIRKRDDEAADSILRVSFELNNHLYNTHDRKLPDAFRERTLDFYITLCHRLMKQRSELARETDSLLGACWSLAEMLFSLRQQKREHKDPDEELLGSAVQACWELCDLFREGWTQIRPDRGTPRPAQTTFVQQQQQLASQKGGPSTVPSVDEYDEMSEDDIGRLNPETPTTIFEDMAQLSPDESPAPNILVLGPDVPTAAKRPKPSARSKSASQAASSSSTSLSNGNGNGNGSTASSTSTIMNTKPGAGPSSSSSSRVPEDPHITCLHLLLVKAAMNLGFSRTASQSLPQFVKALPRDSFGGKQWQRELLERYKKLVAVEQSLQGAALGPPRRARAVDVARSVRWMGQRSGKVGVGGELEWLRDLYRWVFGFWVEEGEGRGDVWIQS